MDHVEQLQRQAGTALHHQVYLVLREAIVSGTYQAGQMLPGEKEMRQRFGVSRVTLRNALATLDREKLIERRQGIGTFVATSWPNSIMHAPVTDLMTHIRDVDSTTSIRLLEYGFVIPPQYVRKIFDAQPDDLFQRVVRLRSRNGKPVFYVTTFLPEQIGRSIVEDDLKAVSMYALMAKHGVRIHSGHQVISATLAEPHVAASLDIAVGAPLLLVKRRHFDQKCQVLQYFEMLASPELFEVNLEIQPEHFAGAQ